MEHHLVHSLIILNVLLSLHGLFFELFLKGLSNHLPFSFMLFFLFYFLLLVQVVIVIVDFSPLIVSNFGGHAFNLLSVWLFVHHFLNVFIRDALLFTSLESEVCESFVIHEFGICFAHWVLIVDCVQFHQVTVLRHIPRLVFIMVH